eukprot:scaffold3821_cov173-Amphora_coffeaeformis.AAC.10
MEMLPTCPACRRAVSHLGSLISFEVYPKGVQTILEERLQEMESSVKGNHVMSQRIQLDWIDVELEPFVYTSEPSQDALDTFSAGAPVFLLLASVDTANAAGIRPADMEGINCFCRYQSSNAKSVGGDGPRTDAYRNGALDGNTNHKPIHRYVVSSESFITLLEETDKIWEDPEGACVVVDGSSLEFVRGATLDHAQEMIISAVTVRDNPDPR